VFKEKIYQRIRHISVLFALQDSFDSVNVQTSGINWVGTTPFSSKAGDNRFCNVDDFKLLISGETFHSDHLFIVPDFTLTALNALLEKQINGSH